MIERSTFRANKFAKRNPLLDRVQHGNSKVDLPSPFRTRASYKRMMLRLRHWFAGSEDRRGHSED